MDAKRRLNREIDLLEFVKTMRITRLLQDVHTTTKQRELTKFFQEYCLSSGFQTSSSSSDEGGEKGARV